MVEPTREERLKRAKENLNKKKQDITNRNLVAQEKISQKEREAEKQKQETITNVELAREQDEKETIFFHVFYLAENIIIEDLKSIIGKSYIKDDRLHTSKVKLMGKYLDKEFIAYMRCIEKFLKITFTEEEFNDYYNQLKVYLKTNKATGTDKDDLVKDFMKGVCFKEYDEKKKRQATSSNLILER